ncbi:hypothetical protein [Cedecea neteri]|uniref:Uncharacterized protein n=1 Tax=Cedecea neteri TaxID=158822 RepID=A0A291DZY4_9ENTR|nr:hypothetical protein [Cedecea neteri]ATF93374.1 hypothetical protein CO704_15290 [Cedecea neteri]
MKGSIVQNIAHKLFLARSDTLEYEPDKHELSLLLKEKSDGYCLKNNKLIFSSYDDRDYYVAYHYFSEMADKSVNSDSSILLTAFSIWEQTLRGDSAIAGLFLSLYEDELDVWQSLLMSERNPYEITSLADQFIKYVKNIDIQKLFNFFFSIYKEKNQYAGHYSSLQERLSNTPQKCHEIIKKFHSDIQPDTIHLYNIALFSLKKQEYTKVIDILIDDIEKSNSVLSPQSLWILGRVIEKSDNKYKYRKILEVIKSAISSPVSLISNAGMQAAVDTIGKIPEIRFVISELFESNNQKIIELLSNKLSITKQLTSHADFQFWLTCICKASMNNDALNNVIFHIFASLAKDESKYGLLADCIFIMIRNNSISEENKSIEVFLHEIVKHQDLLNKLFTLTLIDENLEATIFSRLVATHLFVHENKHVLECCLDTINSFTQKNFIFLVRRILGFISNETQLTSLILSLLKVKNPEKRTYALVKSVIIHEIAMDYPGYVQDEIKRRKDNIKNQRGNMAKLYGEMLAEIDKYISSFAILPRIKELEPPSLLVNNFQKERTKVEARKNDLHEESSIIFNIASKIILKAGIGSFYYNNFNKKGYSEPSYLHEFSSSYSLPRRYVMDNIGYEINMVQFRCAKKDME